MGLGRKWARRLGSRGRLFTRGALFSSSRLIDRYEYDDAARRNHEEGVERQLGIDQNKYGQKEPKRDNKADLYVAEVPRRAWSLWHNGLGRAEHLDNQKELSAIMKPICMLPKCLGVRGVCGITD